MRKQTIGAHLGLAICTLLCLNASADVVIPGRSGLPNGTPHGPTVPDGITTRVDPNAQKPVEPLPPLTPISGLKATVSRPDAVTLTWDALPGAGSYEIAFAPWTRGGNGGCFDDVIDPVAFNSRSYVISGLKPGRYTFTLLAANRHCNRITSAERLTPLKQVEATATAKLGPIIMLSLGDSVLWGQGLREEKKYNRKVEKYIRENNQAQREVKHYVLAHSGAVIGQEGDPIASDATFPVSGEFPSRYPNLYRQKDVATGQLGQDGFDQNDVDLILVSGGANDMQFLNTIVDPTMGHEAIRDWVHNKKVKPRMTAFLGKVAAEFPHARIVVTGYYRAITDHTPSQWASSTASLLISPAAGLLVAATYDEIKKKNAVFTDTMNDALQSVADDVGARNGGRISFVDPMFGSLNGFGADEPFVHQFLNMIPVNGKSGDQMRTSRNTECEKANPNWFLNANLAFCREAGLIHPNAAGAERYFQKIRRVISPVLGI